MRKLVMSIAALSALTACVTTQAMEHQVAQARRSLHEMGMTYHSQADFVEAIKQNDELAVGLFVSAGAVSLAEVDGEVAKLNLTDEQKLVMRTKLAQQYLQMKRLSGASN